MTRIITMHVPTNHVPTNHVPANHVPANLVAERQVAAARLAEYRRHETERLNASALVGSPEGVKFFRGVLWALVLSAGLVFVVWFSVWGWRLL